MQKILKGPSKIPLSLFLLFLFIGVIFPIIQIRRYARWKENDFENQASLICLNTLYEEKGVEEFEEEVEEKIKTFTLSDSRTDFVVLTKEEVLHVVSTNIQSGESIVIKDLCLLPAQGVWQLYIKYEYGNITLPWIVMDVVKDSRETAELYISNIWIGDTSLPGFLERKIIVETNRGISDAVIMLNENRFLGRVVENIELLDERVVFKGSI